MASSVQCSKNVIYMIYLSHGLSSWGDRMWDFAVGLYMVILSPGSLLLTAILGFSIDLAVISFGSPLGSWIDRTSRIKSATTAIIVQNLSIAIGSTGLVFLFALRTTIQATWSGALELVMYAIIIFTAVIANLASVVSDIAIERDWVVVLTHGDEKRLATMNAVMRSIDLTTKILAPVVIGSLISYWSNIAGAVFILVWNIISGIVEIYLLLKIYNKTPQLKCKTVPPKDENCRGNVMKECWGSWRSYLEHPIKWAGIGFSCLYMSVLGFDQITIGYMYNQGVGESLAAIITAFGAVTGIIGSASYPFIRRRFGQKPTFAIGYSVSSVCLLLCVISIFLPGSPFVPEAILNPFNRSTLSPSNEEGSLSLAQLWGQRQNIFCFVGGIVFARFGLWIADLSFTQLLQDRVKESQRGVINGVQNSINQGMDLLKFVLVILLPTPQTFGYLTIATWIFGCFGWLLHSIFVVKSKRNGLPKSSTSDRKNSTEYSHPSNMEENESMPLLSSK